MTKIIGRAEATADQMASYLLLKNTNPKINMPVKNFCQLFLTVAAKEGVRGDALFAQSCKETGFFKYGGTVTADQNNYAGLGTLDASTKGAYFKDEEEGILAQAQHAKGYATKACLQCACVDPRYSLLWRYGKAGTAEHWEHLGGKWAVPGYDTKEYKSLLEASLNRDSYGYHIIDILEEILKMPKEVYKVSKVIALDAGHGLHTAGKRCMKSLDPDQTREWTLNDRIMDLVEYELRAYYECTPLRVDDTTGAKDISLANRVKAANQAKAVAYVSVHHDAGINGRLIGAKGKKAGGTTVYWYSSNPSRASQATRLYASVVNRTDLVGDRSAPIQKKGYYVLKKTNMPAFLIENGFMDSPTDVPVILSQKHARETAKGIVSFLVEEFCLEPKTSVEKPSGQPQIYPAYTGANTTLFNALKSLGIDASYSFRKQIAVANGISGYRGSAAQNTQIYNLLVAGLLKRP